MVKKHSKQIEQYPLSVVIATLGGVTLTKTIEFLNRGTVVPLEILICIPEKEFHLVEPLLFDNVKVIKTKCRGQVAQRALGFQSASHEFVMQIDDDMLVDDNCIEHLLKTIRAYGANAVVAPSFVNLSTGESVYKKPDRNIFLQETYYWFMNGSAGYQPGKIDKSGSAVGIDPQNENDVLFDVEWLAGGCVMHYRKNLVLEDYFPFQGKAYCEDIIHSYYLKSKGCRLMLDANAICKMEVIPSSTFGVKEFLKNLVSDFRARKYAMNLCSRNSSRIYLFYLFSCLNYVYKNGIRSKIFKNI